MGGTGVLGYYLGRGEGASGVALVLFFEFLFLAVYGVVLLYLLRVELFEDIVYVEVVWVLVLY